MSVAQVLSPLQSVLVGWVPQAPSEHGCSPPTASQSSTGGEYVISLNPSLPTQPGLPITSQLGTVPQLPAQRKLVSPRFCFVSQFGIPGAVGWLQYPWGTARAAHAYGLMQGVGNPRD